MIDEGKYHPGLLAYITGLDQRTVERWQQGKLVRPKTDIWLSRARYACDNSEGLMSLYDEVRAAEPIKNAPWS